ncbi:MAG TPA: VOC family protein [Stellaceae bacterium]|nr:VOC family protein [Stellaceae bacterium]
MAGLVAGIDHVIIAVRDFGRVDLNWTRLGFALTPRGRHLQRGTANYCVMFATDYVELLGVVDPAQDLGGVDAFLAQREGIRSIAFASDAGSGTAAALAARGLHPGTPRDLARQVELAEETIVPRFRLVALPPEETPGLDVLFCQHLTPELIRQPAWLAHPNGALALHGVTVVVESTAPLAAAYEKLVGPAAVNKTDAVLTVHAGPHRIVFATPDDFSALYPEVTLASALTLPAAAVLSLVSRDIELTIDHLTQWQVPYETLADGAVLVPPEEANGAALLFTPV